jgi:hypothetical protein
MPAPPVLPSICAPHFIPHLVEREKTRIRKKSVDKLHTAQQIHGPHKTRPKPMGV